MKNLPRFIAVGFPLVLAFGLAGVLPALVAIAASAQPPTDLPPGRGPGGPGGHHRGPGNPIARVLDADRDGEISAAELANATAAIKALDRNGDGTVSADELRPARPARPADAPTPPADRPAPPAGRDHPRPVDPIMLALDANGDGELSSSEIANATASLKALDLNADGKLASDEFRPLPPSR